MSEQAAVHMLPRSAGLLRRSLRLLAYGLGIVAALGFALAWWGVLLWGAVEFALWFWRLVT